METETEATAAGGGYGSEDPFTAMDPEMAAQPAARLQDDAGGAVMSVDLPSGKGILLSRKAEIDEALRHPEIFSSNMDAVDLKNKRPMIPLQIDPPDQRSTASCSTRSLRRGRWPPWTKRCRPWSII